jgi:hypothetical protein
VSLDLAGDRRYGEGGERKAALGIEAVDRLQQAKARDLEEIVEGPLIALVATREMACERQVSLDEQVAIGRVAAVAVPGEERVVSAGGVPRRPRRLPAAPPPRLQRASSIEVGVDDYALDGWRDWRKAHPGTARVHVDPSRLGSRG